MDNDCALKETTIETKQIFKGKILTLTVDTVRLPDGRTATREIIHHNGAVGMVALTDEGEVLLVRQWRHAPGVALLEIPAGAISHGEDPDDCACREMAEEIGFVPRRLDRLTTMYSAPGYVGEAIHLYVARDLVAELADGDDDENVQVVAMTFEDALQGCRDGRICDGKTIAALMLARDFLDSESA